MNTPIHARSHGAEGWFDGAGMTFSRPNPSDPTEVVTTWSAATAADIESAIGAATPAWQRWRRTGLAERCAILRRVASLLEARVDEYALELSREEGKVIGESRGEVARAAAIFEYFAGESGRAQGSVFAGGRADQSLLVIDQPVGVVAVVTPWNFPIAIPAWKVAPALAFGNGVVWKPSPFASLLATRLMECLLEAGLPSGVVTLVHGDGETGAAVLENPAVDAISFTGSTSAGERIVAAAATRGQAVQAELGGKNTLIVCDDANLDDAVAGLIAGAFSGNGEKCTATSRVLVDRAIAEDFLERARVAVEAQRVGSAIDPATDMGPLVSENARDAVAGAIEAAGGSVVARSASSHTGWFVPATVIELSEPRGPLWEDELFGPVVAVVLVDSLKEALELTNASRFGLAGAVYTRDLGRIRTAIEEFDVGMLSINEPTTGGYPHVPFGGWKDSAFGPREQGASARAFYTRSKTVHLRA